MSLENNIIKILYVEDDDTSIDLLKVHLKRSDLNYDLDIAYDSFTAIKTTQSKNYDVVLMDINLLNSPNSKLDGIETSKIISGQKNNLDLPIIFVTGKNTSTLAEDLSTLTNNYGFFSKPINYVKLLKTIKSSASDHKVHQKSKFLEKLYYLIINTFGHDFSEPIVRICNSFELCDDKEFLDAGKHAAYELNATYRTIAKLADAREGNLTQYTFDFAQSVKQRARIFADYKNLEIHFDIPETLKIKSNELFHFALRNYLSNADKYGEHQPVTVKVFESDSYVHCEVQDLGNTNIPADKQEILFNEDYRLPEHVVSFSGRGKGLYITREIINTVLGGQIYVKPNTPKGNIFGFKLPLNT